MNSVGFDVVHKCRLDKEAIETRSTIRVAGGSEDSSLDSGQATEKVGLIIM
jgi:hypothetical protein